MDDILKLMKKMVKDILIKHPSNEETEQFLDAGIFSYFSPFSFRLKGTPFLYQFGTMQWWMTGVQNKDNSTRYYSTEQVLEMVSDTEIKTNLLFHLDLFL